MRKLLIIVAVGVVSTVAAAGVVEPAQAVDSGGSTIICPASKPYVRTNAFGQSFCSRCFDTFACEPAPEPDPLATELRPGGSLYLSATSGSGTTFDYAVWAGAERLDCAVSELPIGTTDVTCTGASAVSRTFSVVVDGAAPTVECTVPAQDVWYGADVIVVCTASDGGSGLQDPADASVTLSTSVADNIETNAAVTGSDFVCDRSGNCTAVGPYDFKVDRKGPSVACGSTPVFLLNETNATVGGAVTDGGSGPATGSVSTLADTSSVGAKSALLTGSDNVGNTTAVTCPYQIDYGFGGFSGPIDGAPTVNTGKGGKTYPVKWRLSDANGSSIASLTAVRDIAIKPTPCSAFTSDPTDALEATATGDTSLRYDSSASQYVYNWATEGAGCYTLFLELSSGQALTAYFELA